MNYKDLEKKSVNELEKMIAEARGSLYDLKLKLSVGQLKDVRALRALKKDIARMLTKLGDLTQEKSVNNS